MTTFFLTENGESGEEDVLSRLELREAGADDLSYIYSKWLHNFREGSSFAKRIRKGIYFQNHEPLIKRILSRAKAYVYANKEEPEIIYGFIVLEEKKTEPIIHYTYIEPFLRGQGFTRRVFTELKLDPNRITFTHFTFLVSDLLIKYPQMLYDPYLIFEV